MHVDQIETPAVLIDLEKVEANILRVQQYLDKHGIAGRPHIKTHKLPELAHMQLRAGAKGITCQKLGEVEVMTQAGIEDIFIPYNILGAAKLERLMALARRHTISVTADSEYTVRGLSIAAQSAAIELPVLIEFEAGSQRCGVQTPQEAATLARIIARAPGLRFDGLMTYPSGQQIDGFVTETRRLLNTDGIAVEIVSNGGTPKVWEAHTHKTATEHRAGTYVYGDRSMVRHGMMTLEQCAMRVLTTVVSRPTADRGILDGGGKTFSYDTMGMQGYGYFPDYPDAQLTKFSEEHGFVDFSACSVKPAIGDRVTVIPNHTCLVSNLHPHVYGMRGEQVEVLWPVLARGLYQ